MTRIKVKIISNSREDILENAINEFIQGKDIEDIQTNEKFTMIIYKMPILKNEVQS